MSKILLAGAMVIASSFPVMAQEYEQENTGTYDFSGSYASVELGSGKSKFGVDIAGLNLDASGTGVGFGGSMGWRQQKEAFVYGAEFTLYGTSAKIVVADAFEEVTLENTGQVGIFGTAGVAANNLLISVHAGWVFTSFGSSVYAEDEYGKANGPSGGFGLEYSINDKGGLRARFNHASYGTKVDGTSLSDTFITAGYVFKF